MEQNSLNLEQKLREFYYVYGANLTATPINSTATGANTQHMFTIISPTSRRTSVWASGREEMNCGVEEVGERLRHHVVPF